MVLIKTGFEGAEGPVGMPDGEYLLAFDVKPDGTLGPRRNFAKYESVKVPGHKDTRIAEGNGADGLAIYSGSAFKIQMLAQGFMGRAK